MAWIHFLYGLVVFAGLIFATKATVAVVLIVLLYQYCFYLYRNSIFKRVGRQFGYEQVSNEEAMLKILTSHLSVFKENDIKVERAIRKKMDFCDVLLVDLTLYYNFRFSSIIDNCSLKLVSGAQVFSFLCKMLGGGIVGRRASSEVDVAAIEAAAKAGKKAKGKSGVRTNFFLEKLSTLDRVPDQVLTAIVYVDSELSLPSIFLAKESVGEKMLAAIGGQDVDFDDDPAFSDRFVLQGTSEGNLTNFFTKPMRGFFVSNMPLSFIFESAGDRFLIRARRLVKRKAMISLIESGNRFHKYFKS
jgi:hypothetical protein